MAKENNMAGDFTYHTINYPSGTTTTGTTIDTTSNWVWDNTTTTIKTEPIQYTFDWIPVDSEKDDLKAENDLLKRTVQSLLELYCGGEEK